MIGELLQGRADVHHVSLPARTPLLELLWRYLWRFRWEDLLTSSAPFDVWLEALKEHGIDLATYGRVENHLRSCRLVSWEFDNSSGYLPTGLLMTWTLKELYYGEMPSDWGFYIEGAIYAADEDSIQNVPGAWIDEESEDDGNDKADFQSSSAESQDDGNRETGDSDGRSERG